MSDDNDVQLDPSQAEAFAQGLFAVAHADGLHERETELVASFWADTGGSADRLAELSSKTAITPAELAAALGAPEARRLFVKTAVMLTYADGEVSDAEAGLVKQFAQALALTDEQLGKVQDEVKDFLLSHLSHIQNVDAVAQVAKKLAI